MKKIALMLGAAVMAFAVPGMAHAQEAAAPSARPFVGVQVGLHDIAPDIDDLDDPDFDIDTSGIIYGVYGGVDFDLGSTAVMGFEGNFNLGDGPIDSEYGIAARLGARVGTGTVIFARAGYQWVDIDAAGLVGLDEDAFDDEDLDIDDVTGDWLVGVGADIAVGPSLGIRVAVDTLGFDTVRPTIGAHFRF